MKAVLPLLLTSRVMRKEFLSSLSSGSGINAGHTDTEELPACTPFPWRLWSSLLPGKRNGGGWFCDLFDAAELGQQDEVPHAPIGRLVEELLTLISKISNRYGRADHVQCSVFFSKFLGPKAPFVYYGRVRVGR